MIIEKDEDGHVIEIIKINQDHKIIRERLEKSSSIDWQWYLITNKKKKSLALLAGVNKTEAHHMAYKVTNGWQAVLHDDYGRHYDAGIKIKRYMENNDLLVNKETCMNCNETITYF